MGKISDYIEKRYSLADLDRDMDSVFYGTPTATGIKVTEETALQTTAVYACVTLIAQTLAELPMQVFKRIPPRGKELAIDYHLYSLLHDAPNPEMPSFQMRETMQGHILLRGNAYAEIDWDERTGRARGIWPLRPDKMKLNRDKGKLYYIYTTPDSQEHILPSYRVWHIPGFGYDGLLGYTPMRLAREAIGLSLATENFGATLFSQGTHPGLIAKMPGKMSGQGSINLDRTLNERYAGLGKAHRLMVLEEGLTIEKIGINPDDAQFLETRKFQLNEICRFYRVPPHLVSDTAPSTSWGTGIEQQNIGFLQYTIQPWLTRWEQWAHMKLMGPEDRKKYFVEFLVQGLLRGDAKSRSEYYNQRFMVGSMSPNDIRAKENENPIDGGDKYYIPLNMIEAGEADIIQPISGQNARRDMSPEDWKEAYEDGTPHWAEDMEPSLFAQEFANELKKRNIGNKLLEIGCGNGRDSIFFTKAGFEVTAIDIAPGAIDLAQKNAKLADVNIDFHEASAEDMPFEDATYNAIFTLSVLHSTNMYKSIPETARVLKQNGLMLIYIYGNTEMANGQIDITISINEFIKLIEMSGYKILDIYTEQQENFDEAGEKHQIIVALLERQ